ncbi:MAG: hypothetical protein APR54_00105 [Candidatus Cloacimonas sp. SDB]|nr:MAG: hypothetical protein APR54_00105 [Candidatus Cloacimonas sp. SDB]
MKRSIIVLLVVLLIPILLNAEIFPKVGTAGLQFLKLGVDARAIGMGKAYTAVTDDISSVYWNPAGLALTPKNQLLFSHTEWVADIQHEFFAASRLTPLGSFALSVSVLHMDYMDITDEVTFGPTGETFTCYDLAAGLTYSNSFTDKFSFGFTVKYLRESLYEYAVDGVSVDFGSLYNTGWKNLTVGMALTNFGPDLQYEIDKDGDGQYDEDPFDLIDNDGDGHIDEDRPEIPFKIPMNFSLGIVADLYAVDNHSVIGSFQLDSCVDRVETYNLGFEYKISTFSLRTGYQFEYDEAGLSAGIGWRVPTKFAIFNIDYSYSDLGDLSESFLKTPHRLTLKMFY